jgi:Fe-S oxidoreductase
MEKLKAEFLQHWHDMHGIPLRTRLIANIAVINKIGSLFPSVFNFFIRNPLTSGILKNSIGFAAPRSIPALYRITFKSWIEKNLDSLNPVNPKGTVCLFIDEFTNYNDTLIGITAVKLLTALEYRVITAKNLQSARTYLSKGFIRKAKEIINGNIRLLSGIINKETPLVGIEPSSILGFRDEYPDLADAGLKKNAADLAGNSFMIDEFIAMEFRQGRISRDNFTKEKAEVLLHGHCQQKAVSSSAFSIEMLSIPENYKVNEIPSGCCGMAGSFGYEKEHFELSNKIGELVLFRAVRNSGDDTIISAPGTSCRHHIKDGTGRTAMHPVEVLYQALKAV